MHGCVNEELNMGMKMKTHPFHLQVACCSCFLEVSVAQEHYPLVLVAEYHRLLWICCQR